MRTYEQTTFLCEIDSAASYVSDGYDGGGEVVDAGACAVYAGKVCRGKVLLYGPVMAPAGAFGMAVFAVADEAEVREVLENDPTVRAGLNTFEVYPMRVGAAQGFGLEEKQ